MAKNKQTINAPVHEIVELNAIAELSLLMGGARGAGTGDPTIAPPPPPTPGKSQVVIVLF